MKVIDPGHVYELDCLDVDIHHAPTRVKLQFVKRIGDQFPGNQPPGYAGTITQEVLRALIDRTVYVDSQRPHHSNLEVVQSLRHALRRLEMRAARERGDAKAEFEIAGMVYPERQPTCAGCGHLLCNRSHV